MEIAIDGNVALIRWCWSAWFADLFIEITSIIVICERKYWNSVDFYHVICLMQQSLCVWIDSVNICNRSTESRAYRGTRCYSYNKTSILDGKRPRKRVIAKHLQKQKKTRIEQPIRHLWVVKKEAKHESAKICEKWHMWIPIVDSNVRVG